MAHAKKGPRFDRLESKIVRQINKKRRTHGLGVLRRNRALARSADYHCRDMLRANFFAHASSNGQSFAERVLRFRPSNRVGETLAYVPRNSRRSARRIVQMWMESPPHRASLLNPRFRRVGVAKRRGSLGGHRAVVFTADFATRR